MGKRLKQQRRGKGSNAYRKPPNTFKADVAFRGVSQGRVLGEVVEFIDDPGHSAPLMRIRYDNREETMLLAPEGIKVGDKIQEGSEATLGLGNILPISRIPEGMSVYNVEVVPGDGGRLARAAGNFATVVSHLGGTTTILMPSKKTIPLNGRCRAEIGIVAGGGMEMQPILKAGKSSMMHHAVNANWPKLRGVHMNPVDHPFGGKQHHKGASSMTSRNAPPGAKVGHIAARRVGRKKR